MKRYASNGPTLPIHPPEKPYRIRKSQSSGKWYVVRNQDNALIAVSQPSIAAAMRLLRKFLK